MIPLHRRKIWLWVGIAVLLLAGLLTLAFFLIPVFHPWAEVKPPDYWPTNGWQTNTPEQQGLASAGLAAGLQTLMEKQVAIDSLMIIRNGYVVLDAYFFPYDGSFPHDMASETKSVMTTLIGIAVDQGLLDLDQPVVSFFPGRTIANLDERKESLTVRHLVSMRNGMESKCFNGDEPTLDVMRASSDWVQSALDRKMVHDPGTYFCYDSPGMHLLSAILQEVTGMTALDFARQNLFEPLGIQEAIWVTDPQGYSHGWGDLHLKPIDSAKLGYLFLHDGVWEGRQIISKAWISSATRAQSRMVGNEYAYGYGWWVSPVDYYAMGRGGQFIHIIPSLNTIVVITGGEYDSGPVDAFLIKSLLGSNRKLAADPTGMAELDAVLAASLQGPSREIAPAPMDTIQMVSGKDYRCASNPVNLTAVRLDFDSPETASLDLILRGQELSWPVGLDGSYRMSPDGQGTRGYWQDTQTFALEIFDVGQLTRLLHFNGAGLELTIPEAELTIVCQVQAP